MMLDYQLNHMPPNDDTVRITKRINRPSNPNRDLSDQEKAAQMVITLEKMMAKR
jgi:hypothetical protein